MRRQSRAQPLPFGPLQTSAAHKPAYHLQPGFTHLPSPVSPLVPFPTASPVSPRILPSIDSQLLSPVSPLSSIMEEHKRASRSSSSDESMMSSVASFSSESSSDFPATPPTSLPGSPSCVHHDYYIVQPTYIPLARRSAANFDLCLGRHHHHQLPLITAPARRPDLFVRCLAQ